MGIIGDMDWFALSLLYVFLMSVFYFLSKRLLNRGDVDPRIYGGLMNLGVGIISFPFAIANGFSFQFSQQSIFLLLTQGLVITVAASLYYTGLKHVELSESIVLEGFQVFSSLLFGLWFFGEELTVYKLAAVLFVFGAIWRISGLGRALKLNRYEWFILISSVFYSLGSMIDKYLVGYSDPLTYLSLGFFSVGIVMTVINIPRWTKNASMFTGNFMKSLAVICVVIAAGYAALYRAYDQGEVSRIAVIIQSQIILTAFLGIVFLRETGSLKAKITSLVLLLVGLYLVRI